MLNRLNFSYSRVEWFSFFDKFINPGVLKVACDYDNKTFTIELFKILRSSSRKRAMKIENFEKKTNHGRVKILGWSKKQNGTFFDGKLIAGSKNVHILYVWRPNLTAKSKKCKNLWFFFEKICVLIGWFCVPIFFLGFWVEPANSVG
jgi:hypothetical protein